MERVIIYHEKQSEDDDAEVIVKIFVEFKDAKGTKACKESLNGRYFGGRIISAEIYDQDLYEHNDLSGWRKEKDILLRKRNELLKHEGGKWKFQRLSHGHMVMTIMSLSKRKHTRFRTEAQES